MGLWSISLVSFRIPGLLKSIDHIKTSQSQMATKTIVNIFSLPLNCPDHPKGQYFHSRSWQLILQIDLRNRRAAFYDISIGISSFEGSRKYSFSKFCTYISQSAFSDSNTASTRIWSYSSIESTTDPYHSIQKAATTCCRACIPEWFSTYVLRTNIPSLMPHRCVKIMREKEKRLFELLLHYRGPAPK